MTKVLPPPTNMHFAIKFLCDADRRKRFNMQDMFDLLEVWEPTLQDALDFPVREL